MSIDENVRTGSIEQPLQTVPNVSLSEEERTWGSYCHFAGVLPLPYGAWVGPLICWLMKKDTSRWVDEQGKCALNFHLTNLIIMLICTITFIGIPLVFAVKIYGIIMSIIAGLKVKEGEPYKYPFSFNLIK